MLYNTTRKNASLPKETAISPNIPAKVPDKRALTVSKIILRKINCLNYKITKAKIRVTGLHI
ncbi:hypothetical protein BC643_3587 [Mangrovibacterium diazotrophicum]|uniref:Uncharacterized protein n=1 Tax=Mangrovibacterium diazotrophicum TaxID=1261403 RepID=A0A419VYX5_9BACT|nr:hypothetical protein BC643_3587 [Mangrovibacterium diazotrophicum]